MKIQTVIHGEIIGETWGGFKAAMPFSVTRTFRADLKLQIMSCITGDFIRDTVKFTGAAYITVTKRIGHTYQKRIGLEMFPSLCTIVDDEA